MAKQHSALTGNELHNPKGIGSESTGSLLILSQSLSAISASGHIVPSADNTYNLGSGEDFDGSDTVYKDFTKSDEAKCNWARRNHVSWEGLDRLC